MAATEKVLETATSRTEEGARPAPDAAVSIRRRMSWSRAAMLSIAEPASSYFFTMACSAGRDAFTSAAFGPLGSTFR